VQPNVSIEVDDVDPHTQLLGAVVCPLRGTLVGRPLPARSGSRGSPRFRTLRESKAGATRETVGAPLVAISGSGGNGVAIPCGGVSAAKRLP
jgi:hypothetical protein